MKAILTVLLSAFLLTSSARAAELSDIKRVRMENAVYELEYVNLHLLAVDNDMYLYYGWMPDDKEAWRKAAESNISELDHIRDYLRSRDMPKEMEPLRQKLAGLITSLQKIYEGVEAKEDDTIKEEYARRNRTYEEYLKSVKGVADRHLRLNDLPDGFDLKDVEARELPDIQDRERYKQALTFLENDDHFDAYAILQDLRQKYAGTAAENIILIRMGDCFADHEPYFIEWMKDYVKDENDVIKLYGAVMETGLYSPVLAEAFAKWRAKAQVWNHGFSNWSEMPNKEYNEKRMELVRTIQKHLKENPGDVWAKRQILSILNLPNINRGGAFGNSNLYHHAALFTDILEEKPESVKKNVNEMEPSEKAVSEKDLIGGENFTGRWQWEVENHEELGNAFFTLNLVQDGDQIKGDYCAVALGGGRIDCGSKDDPCKVMGAVTGNTAELKFFSCYASNYGRAEIGRVDDNLSWNVTKTPEGSGYWCPDKAELARETTQ